MEHNYNAASRMYGGFPKIHKCGAVSPCGESSPFTWIRGGKETLMRLELCDSSHGTDPSNLARAIIRDCETGEILSSFGEGCYYYSLYTENKTAYVLGTLSLPGMLCGEEICIFKSTDLIHWTSRTLLNHPGWRYFNTSLTKGPDGYVLALEANQPAKEVGVPFTVFFATSHDMINWEHMSPSLGFSKLRYMGGPYLRYSNGWFYLISVTELPCRRYTNYIYRSCDFHDWEVGLYNPILMPDEDDRKISPHSYDLSEELLAEISHGFISSNSDIDMCEYQGKTIITYNVGNQLGFYYLAQAEYDGTPDDFLAAYFR